VTAGSSSTSMPDASGRIIEHFELKKKIATGSFGDVYLAMHQISKEKVAVKLESVYSRHPQLEYEQSVYEVMGGGIGIPRVIFSSCVNDFRCLGMERLGPSLEDFFNYCNRRFSLKTVLMLADQLLARVEYMHIKNYIHRDIKPENFLMGNGHSCNTVYVIDLGLAKKYRDRNRVHIPFRDDKRMTGTARYTSINSHAGFEQSRRDDLWSIGYMLLYFLRGSLPWQGLPAATKDQKYMKIYEKKKNTTDEELCRGFPAEFVTYLSYCRALRFDETPDYQHLRQLFRILFRTEGFQHDFEFSWTSRKREEMNQG